MFTGPDVSQVHFQLPAMGRAITLPTAGPFGGLLLAPLPILAGALAYVAHTQAERLVRPPRTQPPHLPSRVGIGHWEDVQFTTADGLTLRGWFVPPAEPGGSAVVLTHGTGGHRGHLLLLAGALHAHGHGLLLFDLRQHGRSDGEVSSFGIHEVQDVLAALAYLRTRPEVDGARLGLLGHSMGGAASLRAAVRDEQVRAVVSISSAASLAENVAEGVRALTRLPAFPLAPLTVWMAERRAGGRASEMRPIDAVIRLRDRPMLLIHGDADRLVRIANGRRLQQAAGPETRLIEIAGAGHRTVIGPRHVPAYRDEVLAFLERHLRPAPSHLRDAAATPAAHTTADR